MAKIRDEGTTRALVFTERCRRIRQNNSSEKRLKYKKGLDNERGERIASQGEGKRSGKEDGWERD